MYSKLPYFIFGFHGCDEQTKEAVLHGAKNLTPSTNKYDWLGSGIYFWEQNEKRALAFASLSRDNPGKYTSRPIHTPAVIGAVIDLGNCLNLLDSAHIDRLESAYAFYRTATELNNAKMAKNCGLPPDRPLRFLDRAVIETLHELTASSVGQMPYDTVRGLFIEGPPAYDGAGFHQNTHIQVCVRNINCIKAYFDPRKKESNGFIVHKVD